MYHNVFVYSISLATVRALCCLYITNSTA